eukprot:764993-Hanusia_phi.AAC.2
MPIHPQQKQQELKSQPQSQPQLLHITTIKHNISKITQETLDAFAEIITKCATLPQTDILTKDWLLALILHFTNLQQNFTHKLHYGKILKNFFNFAIGNPSHPDVERTFISLIKCQQYNLFIQDLSITSLSTAFITNITFLTKLQVYSLQIINANYHICQRLIQQIQQASFRDFEEEFSRLDVNHRCLYSTIITTLTQVADDKSFPLELLQESINQAIAIKQHTHKNGSETNDMDDINLANIYLNIIFRDNTHKANFYSNALYNSSLESQAVRKWLFSDTTALEISSFLRNNPPTSIAKVTTMLYPYIQHLLDKNQQTPKFTQDPTEYPNCIFFYTTMADAVFDICRQTSQHKTTTVNIDDNATKTVIRFKTDLIIPSIRYTHTMNSHRTTTNNIDSLFSNFIVLTVNFPQLFSLYCQCSQRRFTDFIQNPRKIKNRIQKIIAMKLNYLFN